MTEVLHLTPHLGGGVGKALATLVQTKTSRDFRHVIVCLEQPEKTQFLDQIRESQCEVVINPDHACLDSLVAKADILQLEWWNHPATIEALCNLSLHPIRLLVWCHVSGLYNPTIPVGLINAAQRFIFTSPCSWQNDDVVKHNEWQNKLGVISSAGGFESMPHRHASILEAPSNLKTGYIGSLNFSKLHPDYVRFLASVDLPNFTVSLFGDLLNREELERQCLAAGKPELLQFHGYTSNVVAVLEQMDILAYLLNPLHYGTAENALLEAMAMGVLPIVLSNPAERCIVTHGETGLVLSTPEEFAAAIKWLSTHPAERIAMGQKAAASVRQRFTAAKMAQDFEQVYSGILPRNKEIINFCKIFGENPAEWFLSFQDHPEWFLSDGQVNIQASVNQIHHLFERNKGSVFHFNSFFPEDPLLTAWAISVDMQSLNS